MAKPDNFAAAKTSVEAETNRLLLEAANEGTWYWDLSTDEITFNQRQYEILGLLGKRSTFNRDNMLALVHPDDRATLLNTFEISKSSGNRFDTGFRLYQQSTNDYRFVLLRGCYMYNAKGEATHMIALQKDDTERWKLAKTLERNLETESFRREFVEMVSKTLDLEEILSFSSKRLCEFFKADRCATVRYTITPEEEIHIKLIKSHVSNQLINHTCDEDLPLHKLPKIECINPEEHAKIDKTTYPKPVISSRYKTFLKNSILPDECPIKHIYELIGICPICASEFIDQVENLIEKLKRRSTLSKSITYQNKIYGQIILEQCLQDRVWTKEEADIMDLILPSIGVAFYQAEIYLNEKIAKQEAEVANNAKDLFLSKVTHELVTPLNSILGYSQMMDIINDSQFIEKGRKYAKYIHISGQQLLDIIKDLLDISEKTRNFQTSMEWVTIKPLIDNILQTIQPLATLKKISINVYIQPDLYEVRADPIRLKQILLNLINNAVKYNHDGGKVTVNIEKFEQCWVVFKITDTGIGIAKDQILNIFEPFYQRDESLTRANNGIGVGLAMVKSLTAIHYGTISVESEEGKGSTFTVKLPLRSEKN